MQAPVAKAVPAVVIKPTVHKVNGTFVIGSGTASGTGSATDTNGNVYKLLF